jgi:hypothetical protein
LYGLSRRVLTVESCASVPTAPIAPLDDRADKRTGPWRKGVDRRCYLGTYLRSPAHESCFINLGTAKQVRTVGVIATTGPKAGLIFVKVGKVQYRISLHSKTVKRSQVLLVRLPKTVTDVTVRLQARHHFPSILEGIVVSPV